MTRTLWCLTIAGMTLLTTGCGGSPTAAEQFVADQEGIVTPHGRIDPSSASETQTGEITYRTTNGQTWKVARTKSPDGSPRYGVPTEIPTDGSVQKQADNIAIAKKNAHHQAGARQPGGQ